MNMNRNEKLKALAKKAYECANINNDDYTTYPIGDGWVVQVSTIENGKTFNFISPANTKKRMEKQLLDNKRNNYLPENGAESNNTKDEMFTHDGTSFYDNLVNVKIPEGFTTIGQFAFYNCSSLTSITLPEGVTSIGQYAFYNCSSLTSIILPEGLITTGSYVFQKCTSLTSITIPNSVTSISYGAFYGCTSLTSITLPESLTSIGESAFHSCSSLTSIDLPKGLTSIGKFAFSSCTSLKTINFKGTDEQWNAISKGSNWCKNCPSDMVINFDYQGE